MNKTVVKRMRRRMVDLGIDSWAELARRAGVDRSYVCHILRGTRKAQKTRKKIAKVLGIPARSLLAA